MVKAKFDSILGQLREKDFDPLTGEYAPNPHGNVNHDPGFVPQVLGAGGGNIVAWVAGGETVSDGGINIGSVMLKTTGVDTEDNFAQANGAHGVQIGLYNPSSFVLYSGATANVNLGARNFGCGSISCSGISNTGILVNNGIGSITGNARLGGNTIIAGSLVVSGGVVGYNAGAVCPAGIVGEIGSYAVINLWIDAGSANKYYDIGSMTLTAGDWDIHGGFYWAKAGVSNATQIYYGISTWSGNTFPDLVLGTNRTDLNTIPVGLIGFNQNINGFPVNITTTTTYYIKTYHVATTGSINHRCMMWARRIR